MCRVSTYRFRWSCFVFVVARLRTAVRKRTSASESVVLLVISCCVGS